MSTLLIMYVTGGILLTLIAIPLYFGKIGPNGLYGFRVKKTMENPEIWYPVNQYSAGWLMLTGVLTVLCAVGLSFVPGLSVDTYALVCLAVFAGVITVGLVMTVRYMNSL